MSTVEEKGGLTCVHLRSYTDLQTGKVEQVNPKSVNVFLFRPPFSTVEYFENGHH